MVSLVNLIVFYILIGLLLYTVDLNLLGLLYLLIYVGAISVLFIFILSLINIRANDTYRRSDERADYILEIVFIFVFTFSYLYVSMLNYHGFAITNVIDYDQVAFAISEFTNIGELLYTEYALIFLILGLILLLSIITGILLIFRINLQRALVQTTHFGSDQE